MRGDDGVGEAGADRVIGAGDAAVEEPLRADRAARFLVVSEVQLDRPGERGAELLQGEEGIGIGGEVRFRDGDAAAIHPPVADLGAVRVGGPPLAGRHHIAMRIERDRRAGSERLPHDEVGDGEHAARTDERRRHIVALDRESQPLEQRRGAHRMRHAVARRVVRGRPHELREKTRLLLAAVGEELAHSGPKIVRHDAALPPGDDRSRRRSARKSWRCRSARPSPSHHDRRRSATGKEMRSARIAGSIGAISRCARCALSLAWSARQPTVMPPVVGDGDADFHASRGGPSPSAAASAIRSSLASS